jgi:hypothetical protein
VTGRAAVAQLLAGKRRAHHNPATETLLDTADVVDVLPAGASDGTDLVTIGWLGGEITARYCERYTPTVGDTVLVGHSNDTVYIIDRLIGAP